MKGLFTYAIAPALLQTILFATPAVQGQSSKSLSRVERVKSRGYLTCGLDPGVAGFAEPVEGGGFKGLDADICRAIATAVLGSPAVRFTTASSLDQFASTPDIDVVSRRLTVTLERESLPGITFGPVVFYDGQGFLVKSQLRAAHATDLKGVAICVEPGTAAERRMTLYFRARNIQVTKRFVKDVSLVEQQFANGNCDAYTADISELASFRSRMRGRDSVVLLPEQISKEPLAPLLHSDDPRFIQIVRWTIYTLISAEELRVSSSTATAMQQSEDPEVRRLLGLTPGIGAALGLDEKWAARTIAAVGNYGQIYERNLGRESAVRLDRGINRLWRDGGLMYAPPLR